MIAGPKQPVSKWGALSLGVGGVVGAGIFVVMGEASAIAGSAVWMSFLAAGFIAFLTGHSFVRLGLQYPGRGGVVEYLVQGFGEGLFSGGISVLYYFAQLIGFAMLGLAFGRYVASFIGIEASLAPRVLGSVSIGLLCGLQLSGSTVVGRLQGVLVTLNLLILTLVGVGILTLGDVTRLSTSSWPPGSAIASAVSLTFFAFTGFAVINNAIEQLPHPSRDLPFALFGTLGVVSVLYLILSIGAVAAVDTQTLHSSGPLLLVEAGRMVFGGEIRNLLLVSAILATVTCMNSGLYSMTQITYALAEKGELPSRFRTRIRASTRGVTVSACLGILLMNTMNLGTIASVGSATVLLVYMLVNLSAVLLVKGPLHTRLLCGFSLIACVTAVLVWLIFTLQSAPRSLLIFLAFLVTAFTLEWLLQHVLGRTISCSVSPKGEGAPTDGTGKWHGP